MNTNDVLNKLIAEIERLKEPYHPYLSDFENGRREGKNDVLDDILSFITSLHQEQPMPNSTELIAKWEEEKDVLKQMNFRGDEWRLAQNAFMDGVGIGLSVRQEQKCIFGNTPSEDICLVCSAACPLRVPKTKVSTSTEIATPSEQADELTFEEYLRGCFEINNGIENDPDNLVRIHAPELLKLARKQEQPKVDLENEMKKYFKGWTETEEGIACNYQYVDLNACRGIARHFYELGQHTKYQQDRAEFAKLKAKEWQSGYHAGYAKGLNARKEE